jgi:hypothetical protein
LAVFYEDEVRDVSEQQAKSNKARKKSQGQGVVEYAGALVIAAVIVAMGITVLPPNLAGMLQNLQASMLEFLLTKIPA